MGAQAIALIAAYAAAELPCVTVCHEEWRKKGRTWDEMRDAGITEGFGDGILLCTNDCLGFDPVLCEEPQCGNGLIEGGLIGP